MATSGKENMLILLALVITYLGVYLLSVSGDLVAAEQSDARWAGIFSVTLGVFTLLTLLFGHASSGAVPVGTAGGDWGNIYLLVAGVALAVSAYYNFRLVRTVGDGMLRNVLWANIIAHVVLVFLYFSNFGASRPRFDGLRTAAPVLPAQMYQAGGYSASPRLSSVRVR